MTRWAKDVKPYDTLREYPRPQLVRDQWMNLNGLWDFAIGPKGGPKPATFPRQILVPFPAESALSGVMTKITEKDQLWYRRFLDIPSDWFGHILLHFGAVDFETTVWVNGQQVGQHRGGYDPFSFDITDKLRQGGGNDIVVSVWDPTDASPNSRGKQVRKPDQGIFYTATSGIWQTVWLEPVPVASIASVKVTPDVDGSRFLISVALRGAPADNFYLEATAVGEDGRQAGRVSGRAANELSLAIQNPRLWTPEAPFLYDLKIALRTQTSKFDEVRSYSGLRKVALGSDKGVTRIFLNNKPFFMLGPLDQGFWPDGLYTAPTDEALRSDIETTKQLGFNMARKHVKVEPDRWYYWCDKLGLLVWQDMPSGDKFISPTQPDIIRTADSASQFETELKALIQTHYNHPSIVMWVVFNEGWGQYDTPRVTKMAKELDPTRLVNNASGWADRKVGDVNDMHRYPGPGSPNPEDKRAAVLGEFGGLGFKIDGHTWAGRTWGYRGMESIDKLTRQYTKLLRGVYRLKDSPGLSAAVYTQTTDVEYEGNGLMTYDREVIKMPVEAVAAANRGKFPPEPAKTVLTPTAQTEPVVWRYTTEKPPDDWFKPEFDASSWKQGKAGFGTKGTPGAIVGTEWSTADIWLRREFTPPAGEFRDVALSMHHDEDAEVYINGVLAARPRRFTSDYDDVDVAPEAVKALKPGKNVLAVHCHQTTGGQYIDVGIISYGPAAH
ncbi:MAG TPA: glycoside hydrolase family 2 TIM barrel-domain containing protein [Verrucomicrobiae bacterium]|nr:glycoside hydrolase family 2 TIM barrel-domain containing protein [Verrucomicrobiae bacterium]